jgi:RNase H-fold protein (predicted Holliday junction resolvase)
MDFVIESNVPMPVRKIGWKRKLNILEVAQGIPFNIKDRAYVQSEISRHFPKKLQEKRFTVTCENQPMGMAIAIRLTDELPESEVSNLDTGDGDGD